MTNYEKYQDKVITQLRTGGCELYRVALTLNNGQCEYVACDECRKIAERWLAEEAKGYAEGYVELGIDWDNVEIDTPVLVANAEIDGVEWFYRYFAGYNDGIVYTWANGATSSSVKNSAHNKVGWDYAKLYDGEK